jgi:hypothetical protein
VLPLNFRVMLRDIYNFLGIAKGKDYESDVTVLPSAKSSHIFF